MNALNGGDPCGIEMIEICLSFFSGLSLKKVLENISVPRQILRDLA